MNCTCQCCRECKKRSACCHLTCAEYLAFKAEREVFNRVRERENRAKYDSVGLVRTRHWNFCKIAKYKHLD